MIVEDEEDKDVGEQLAQLTSSLTKSKDKLSQATLLALSNLSEAIGQMVESQKVAQHFDKELGGGISKSIEAANGKLSTAIDSLAKEMGKSKIDLSPIAQANRAIADAQKKSTEGIIAQLLDIQNQNKEYIKAITGLQKETPKDDSQMADLLKTLTGSIVSSNNAVIQAIKAMNEPKHMEPAKPKEFKHKVFYREGGRQLDYVESKEVV